MDILKLSCTLPKLANFCLDKSTNAQFNPLTEGDKDLLVYWNLFDNKRLVDQLSFLHAKHLLKKLLFENLQT